MFKLFEIIFSNVGILIIILAIIVKWIGISTIILIIGVLLVILLILLITAFALDNNPKIERTHNNLMENSIKEHKEYLKRNLIQEQILVTIKIINSKYTTESTELIKNIYGLSSSVKAKDFAKKNDFDFSFIIKLIQNKDIEGYKKNGAWYITNFRILYLHKRKIELKTKKLKNISEIIEYIDLQYNTNSSLLIKNINKILEPIRANDFAQKNDFDFSFIIKLIQNKDIEGYKKNGIWYIKSFIK